MRIGGLKAGLLSCTLSRLFHTDEVSHFELQYPRRPSSVVISFAVILSLLYTLTQSLHLIKRILVELFVGKTQNVQPVSWLATVEQKSRRQPGDGVQCKAVDEKVVHDCGVQYAVLECSTLYVGLEGSVVSFHLSVGLWMVVGDKLVFDSPMSQESFKFLRNELGPIVADETVWVALTRKHKMSKISHRFFVVTLEQS